MKILRTPTNCKFEPYYLIQKLFLSEFPFQLTGSYFFGHFTLESDIDLFTVYSSELETFLVELGFIKISTSYASDPYIQFVYRKINNPSEPPIDVQILPSMAVFRAKSLVQAAIKERWPNYSESFFNALSKTGDTRRFWSNLILFALCHLRNPRASYKTMILEGKLPHIEMQEQIDKILTARTIWQQ